MIEIAISAAPHNQKAGKCSRCCAIPSANFIGWLIFEDLKQNLAAEENMVINVDLPYHELGFGGMHLEDMVRVTKDGCEPFTSMQTELIVIP